MAVRDKTEHGEILKAIHSIGDRLDDHGKRICTIEQILSTRPNLITLVEDVQTQMVAAHGKISDALEPLDDMRTDIAATKDIVEAWKAVGVMATFIKWFGAAAAGFLAVWALAKAMARGLV